MKTEVNELEVNGETYVKKSSISKLENKASTTGLPYVVVRSRDSGCHAGFLKEEDGNTLTLIDSRRLWYWDGAATLSQLANEGVTKPESCKFPDEVSLITIYGCCEKITATSAAFNSIKGVPVWRK